MKIDLWAFSHRGRRLENQDAVGASGLGTLGEGAVRTAVLPVSAAGTVVAVADGVGGRPRGRDAAHVALTEVCRRPLLPNARASLDAVIASANRKVAGLDEAAPPATTLAGISISEEETLVFNVGDSRVYALDAGAPRLLSIDHTSTRDPRCITRFLGGAPAQAIPDVQLMPTELGSGFLICTDGFYAFLATADLLLLRQKAPNEALLTLSQRAVENGSTDNLSAIYCSVN